MSSAYMSRLQHDVQLSNLYLNHSYLVSLKDELDSLRYLHKLHSLFYLCDYLNMQFIFNLKHFSCFILNKIFNAKVFMHYFNSISLKYHIKSDTDSFFSTKTPPKKFVLFSPKGQHSS